jgi:two-component system cell cycle sensor histidine kinase/response regulator CckA
MRLATGNHLQGRVARSAGEGHSDLSGTANENQNRALCENSSSQDQEHLPIVARATNDAIRDWDVKSGSLSWPQGLESLLGYCRSSAAERIGFWQEQVHPGDRARVAASIGDALAGTSEHWSGEYRFRGADGSYLQLFERALIIRDGQGKAIRVVGSLMDVTARKQLHDQLCRSQKMEAFGQLAGSVAHDFNNFLTTILGYCDLVLAETGRKGVVAEHVAEIRAAAGRASALTGQLLAFSRRQALEPRVVEVNALIANLERSLLRLIGENIRVVCHLHDEKQSAHIRVDPGQLTQLILNLAINARDAMPNGGQLTLETSIVDVSKGTEAACASEEFRPGQYVLISVADTGIGMSDEVKAHLFEPFFTTKEEGRGSGLGLATSYGIVRQSGGYIRIESESGRGTTVRVYLPKVAPPPAPSYKKPSAKKPVRGTETILVLEDDISVRHVSVRVLRNLGYQVIEAANSDDAQRLIGKSADKKIHLLLTDMVMPQMSGRRFADWLRSASPQIKVICISGYLEESLHPGDRRDAGMFFLPKPFDSEQLATKVRETLDSK